MIANASVKTSTKRGVTTREPNTDVFRDQLRDNCLTGWSEFTYEKFLRACNRALPIDGMIQVSDTETKKLSDSVPFGPNEATTVLEHARGVIDGEVRNFDDWLYNEATRIAEVKTAKEAVAKNG
jgi:hypothetical protein